MCSCFLSLNKLILPDLAFFQLQVNNPEFWEGKKIHYGFLVGDRCAWYKILKVWRIRSENVSPSSACPAGPACTQARAALSPLRDASVCVCAWLHVSLCSLSTVKCGKRSHQCVWRILALVHHMDGLWLCRWPSRWFSTFLCKECWRVVHIHHFTLWEDSGQIPEVKSQVRGDTHFR